MPSAYPFPSIASLTLSMMLTVKRVDTLARETVINPWERAAFVVTLDNSKSEGI